MSFKNNADLAHVVEESPKRNKMVKSIRSTSSNQRTNVAPYHTATLKSMTKKSQGSSQRTRPMEQIAIPQLTSLQQNLDSNLSQFTQQMKEIEEKIQQTQSNMEKM